SRRAVVAYDLRRARDRLPAQTERACEDFFVEDASGRARVLAADIELVLEPVKRVREALETRILAQNVPGPAAFGAGSVVRAVWTTFERVLAAGDEVVVAGQAIRTLGVSHVTVALHAGAGGPVLVTNRNVAELRAETQLLLWLAVVLATTAVLLPFV